LWSGVALAVVLKYHIPEPVGETAVTTNGHTYYGNPPALTLYQSDPVSFVTVAVALGAALLISLVDLVVRVAQRTSRVGVGAVVAGSLVVLFSLFGLLWGVIGVGVVGALLIVSGLAPRATVNP
jgi:hypothetical protein